MARNVLFILVDCLRSDRVGGMRKAITPTLDSLRARGAFFPRTIASATVTWASTATILTGLHPFAHGARAFNARPLRPLMTMAETFAANGYHTYAEVTGPLFPELGFARGFNQYAHRDRNDHLEGLWGDLLLRRLREGSIREPWFLFLHLFDLHRPRRISPGFNTVRFGKNRYDRALSSLDASLAKLIALAPPDCIIILTGDHGEAIQQTRIQEYVERAKRRVLQIRRPWHRRNLARAAFMDHGYHVYNYLTKVPLIIVAQGLSSESRTFLTQVRHVDILPTLIELLDLRSGFPYALHGASLVPIAQGLETDDRVAYSEAAARSRGAFISIDSWDEPSKWLASINTGKHKYVFGPDDPHIPEELYNLLNDPEERHNLIERCPELRAELRAKLHSMIQQSGPLGAGMPEGHQLTVEEEETIQTKLKGLGYF